VRAIGILRTVPASACSSTRRLRNVRAVLDHAVNAFLREIAGIKISLKDFRT
jgi:DNA topoisomerase-1